ncbi:hypothetical protein WR25_24185 [Diploscapter pachys]|uniref:Uncharacterized protein n=1 Tax=Diploscapter pachys TaxID=2018661 RepID=A0A2A2KYV7_9BILA|nr:hypothetical protein WR25_24185 [Diploscapter pachys]
MAPPGVISSIERYHQLLLRKYGSSTTQAPQESTTTKTVTVALRKRPKSLKHIYSTINPKTKKVWKAVTSEVKNKPKKPVTTITTTTLPPPPATSTSTTKTTTTTTTTTSASTSLPRFICKNAGGDPAVPDNSTQTKRRTIAPFRKIERVTFRPLRPRIDFVTTRRPLLTGAGAGQYSLRKTFWDYLWPNSELIAAIKDVFTKFKASLDEAGLDQDVRLMGNQLKNTWQQLRTGIDRGLRVVKQSAENSVQQMNGSLTPREIMSIGAVMSNSERGSRRIEIPGVDSKLERLDQILDEY